MPARRPPSVLRTACEAPLSTSAYAGRAASAEAALAAYLSRTACDCVECLAELLWDLMRLADMARLDFAEDPASPAFIIASQQHSEAGRVSKKPAARKKGGQRVNGDGSGSTMSRLCRKVLDIFAIAW